MDLRFRTGSYLAYLRNSVSRYRVHSPFVYSFIEDVLKGKDRGAEIRSVLDLREELLNDRSTLHKQDHGAGSERSKVYEVSIREVTKGSVNSPHQLSILHRLVKSYKPSIIVELGTALGVSTAALALGNRKGTVISIEGSPELSAKAKSNLAKLGIDNAKIVTGNFDEVLPSVLESAGNPGLFFIDGNHRYAPTVHYFETFLEHAGSDSIAVLDDIYWSGDMAKAWNEIRNHPRVRVSVDIYRKGFVFLQKGLARQHFVIRY